MFWEKSQSRLKNRKKYDCILCANHSVFAVQVNSWQSSGVDVRKMCTFVVFYLRMKTILERILLPKYVNGTLVDEMIKSIWGGGGALSHKLKFHYVK